MKVPLNSFKNIRTCIATLYFFFFNLVQFSNSDTFQWWNQRWVELHNLNDHYISTKWYSFKVDKPIIWWMDVILNCSSQLQVGRWLEGTRTNFRPMFLLFLLKTPEKRGYKKETLAWNDLINWRKFVLTLPQDLSSLIIQLYLLKMVDYRWFSL